MRQYAVLRNVVRDVNFGVVVKSAGTMKFFGWSEKAVEWANWANANNANLDQLPANISIGEFKGMSDEMMKNIILSSEEATAAGSSTIKTKTLSFNVGGERHQHSSKFPSFVDSPIASDWMAKTKSINFKALNFKKEVSLSEISLGMRTHELAFNNETKQFVARPNRITATYSRSKIQKKISRGAERKFGKQITEYTNKEILKNYVAPTIKRDSMGRFTKEILDVYTKAKLGRAIGRAVGGAARGITPNRRTRGVASRFISGVLDPRKRRDVDGDGMIFDGTWREMPDPNRFAKVPEGLRSSGRLRGMDLPGGGGVGIRSTDPRENAELERSRRAEMDMRRRFSDDMAKIMNELRDAGLTTEKPKRGKRERRLSDGTSLRSSGATANEPPRAATAVQMAFDTRNSRKASKMTYDPQTNSVEVTYNDGRTRKFDNVPYQEARRAGADDAIDRLIADMETGRIGKESKEPMMGLRSSGSRRKPDVDMTDMTPEEREANRPSSVSEEEYRRRIRRDVERSLRRADEEGFRSSGRKPNKDVVSEINRSYDSMMVGGDDFDTGLRNIAESAGIDLRPESDAARAFDKLVSRLAKIDAADGPANREELPGEEGAFGETLVSRAFSNVDGVTRRQIDKLAEAVNAFVDASDKNKATRRTGLRSSGSETPRKNLQPLPTNVRSFIKRLKEKYSKPTDSNDPELTESLRKIMKEREARDGIARENSLQSLFRELENGFISDRNRKAALDFLDSIEKDYQKQDNQSPSVTTRPVSQEDRIAAAHLAKLIAMSDDYYKESSFNPIKGIDYSPIPEALKRRIEQDRQFNEDFDRRNPNLARQPRASSLRSSGNLAEVDDDAGRYDDMPSVEDAVNKLATGDRMSVDELDYLEEVADRILDDPDTPENIRDSMLDLKNAISARRRTGSDSLRSSGGGGRQRGRMSVDPELKKFLKGWEKIQSPLSEEDDRGSFGAAIDAALRSPIRNIPGIKENPNGGWDLSDVDFESITDDQLISLLSLFPELGPSPLRARVDSRNRLNEYLNPNSNKKNSVDAIAKELRKRGYKVSLGKAREPKYYGDYSAGDRYWVARKTNATLSARAKKGQTTRARRPARDGELTPLRSQQTPSSRGAAVETPLSTRRSLANTQRAARPKGTSLRSSGSGGDGKTRTPVPKSAGRGAGAGPGGKAGHNRMKTTYGKTKKGDDGKVFDSLTPEQQAAVKKELAETVKPALDTKLKTFFSKYWKARTERGSKKQSVVAVRRRAKGDARGRYEKVAEDTPLESADIYEMLYRLDGQVAEGLLEKFEVSDKDSRELKLDEDGNAKVSTVKNGYTNQQRTLDDAQTILNMMETDDFSALEHLHPSTKKKIADVIKKNGGEVPKGWIDSESSVAGWAGGEGRTKAPDAIDLEKERGIGKKKKDKRLSLFQRLRRVDPERERRVELRAARRQGRIREGIALDPDLELKRRVLRARAMKRTFMSRFRKSRDPEALATDMKARADEAAIVKSNPVDGTVTISDNYVDLLHSLGEGLIGINEKKKRGKISEEELESEHTTLLRRLWENSGFSETPVQLKEDEVKTLLDAGWQPIMRGTGHEKINSETYVEQFITSEGRFIPGRNGSAYGIGEYFSFPGEWGSYHSPNPADRHTLTALLPPTATIITRSEIKSEHANLGNITTRISDAFKVFGGRDVVKAMEPDELVAEIDKAVPDLAEDKSRTGQVIKQLRDRMEALSKLPRNDDVQRAAVQEQKEKILNSLDYLQRFSKQRQAEMIAPIIGVDAIDTNDGDIIRDPMLLHNRTIVAVFQNPTNYDDGLAMVSGPNGEKPPKAWTKWKRKATEVADRQAPTRRRRSRTGSATKPTPATPTPTTPTPAKPTPAAPSAPNSQGTKAPVDVSSWTSSRPQSTGSNPATLLTAPDGTQYYTKLPKGTPDDKDRMETEALASELYKLAGVESADVQMGTRNGQPVTLSRMIQSRMPNSQADQDEALKGYVVDAWLANWDAPLNDNIKIDSNGNAVRLDVGGSLDFRAQGARKGKAWGNTVGEIDSMKKRGAYLDYNKITDAAIKQQAKALGNVTDVDIRATVSRIVSDPARAKALADTLIARRDDIVKRYA